MKIYLAGKIYHTDWRHSIVAGLRNALAWDGSPLAWAADWPILQSSIFDLHDYTGPYFTSDDHGCAHGKGRHGAGPSCNSGDDDEDGMPMSVFEDRRRAIFNRCLAAIRASDVVFAWIERPDAYGTLAELGYAHACGKRIWIAYDAKAFRYVPDFRDDLWFIGKAAEEVDTFSSAKEALTHYLFTNTTEWANGFVYLLKSGDHYKIGRARSVDDRVKQISPKTPLPVELVHSFPCQDVAATEYYLHLRYQHRRTNGEWFALNRQEIDEVKSIKFMMSKHTVKGCKFTANKV